MAATNEPQIVNSGTSGGIADDIRQLLHDKFGDSIVKEEVFRGDHQYTVRPEKVFDICQALVEADRLDIRYLADITCVDWLDHPEQEHGRYEVVYNLCSITHKFRFYLKARLPDSNPHIRTLVDLWNGANWMEREVWDLFGIVFDGHPDLTKVLTADDLEGHPLRRDFPLTWEQPQFSWNKDEPPEVVK